MLALIKLQMSMMLCFTFEVLNEISSPINGRACPWQAFPRA